MTVFDRPRNVKVNSEHRLAGRFMPFKSVTATIEFDDGPESQTRELLGIGRVAAVLPYDQDRQELVMIRQFRLGAHLGSGIGELVEIPAGHVDEGENTEQAALRELTEETGLCADKAIHCMDFLSSPGMVTEHAALFLALVDSRKISIEAGLEEENERTHPFAVPLAKAFSAADAGQISNAFTLLGLYWFRTHQQDVLNQINKGAKRFGSIVT